MKILLSGFEKFGAYTSNSSEVILKRFSKCPDIVTLLLPVTFESSFKILETQLSIHEPDIVICMGQAANRNKISLEKLAVNFIDSEIPDNAGKLLRNESIIPSGPAAFFSTLPLSEMLKVANSFPVEISYSAGTYVCNELFYRLMFKLQGSSSLAGFVHLPGLKNNEDEIFNCLEQMFTSIIPSKIRQGPMTGPV